MNETVYIQVGTLQSLRYLSTLAKTNCDVKIFFGRCIVTALAERLLQGNSRRGPSETGFLKSCISLASHLGIILTPWDLVLAKKAGFRPEKAGARMSREERVLVAMIVAALPRVAMAAGEVTAIDFTRLPNPPGWDGPTLFLTIAIDVYLRVVRGFFLHQECPTSAETIAMLRELRGPSLRYLRSDHGSIYTSLEMRRYLQNVGASHEFIPKGAPWWNGHLECFNRTFKTLWAQAPEMSTSAQIRKEIAKIIERYHQTQHSALGSSPC